MGSEYIKTIHGIISIVQICIGAAALFACSFIWSDSNVYFQFYWGSYPAHIYAFLALFLTWVAVIGLFVLEVSGRDILETLGKMKIVFVHLVCLVMIAIAAALDSYYISSHDWNSSYYRRLITVTVFEWILVVSYFGQMIYIFFQ